MRFKKHNKPYVRICINDSNKRTYIKCIQMKTYSIFVFTCISVAFFLTQVELAIRIYFPHPSISLTTHIRLLHTCSHQFPNTTIYYMFFLLRHFFLYLFNPYLFDFLVIIHLLLDTCPKHSLSFSPAIFIIPKLPLMDIHS